ncbi:phytanoyl-CoA dioxygenase family protein [Penicillium brasilianum]|uniref:Phytanoyl-CoA dioxygenase family protein n=1 Tax=Penicillium brasilianum TaxID=104259 RepID=A0A1S9RQ69_PENBI|nr:phytanoyl-CoA dioxygenase family protein [Penicillium brasilianum]
MAQPALHIIKLTSEELASKKLSSRTLQAALEALHKDGILALENAVDTTHLDKLNARMIPEAQKLYSNTATHRNFGQATGNIQQEPVVEADYIFEDILANPWATSIVEHMIGPNPQLRFYSANTAFKASGRQPPHIDVDFAMPRIPFGYCININLVSTSPENGATEVWLGSHIDTDDSVFDRKAGDLQIKAELLEQRRKINPPVQPSLPKGSLIIRDLRLWHAGMPNKTDEPRVMLVSIQFPSWYRSDQRLILPRVLEGKIDFGRTVPFVEWVGEDYDYLQGAHDHDLTLKP